MSARKQSLERTGQISMRCSNYVVFQVSLVREDADIALVDLIAYKLENRTFWFRSR